jgi:hypothetical protein
MTESRTGKKKDQLRNQSAMERIEESVSPVLLPKKAQMQLRTFTKSRV